MNLPAAAMVGIAASFGIAAVAVQCSQAAAAPCAKHSAETKITKHECLREVKRKAQRSSMAWPPNPSPQEIRVRVDKIGGKGTWDRAWQIARCETGANPRHFPNGKYIGMMGMYRQTYAYGAKATGYPSPHTATPQQQIAIAVASWPITRGWGGWGCA
jgi:hypothetical protein